MQSEGATSAVAEKLPIRVCLDPGHGGTDPGAIGASGTPEKQYNLQVALLVRKVLQSLGYAVVMTRENDRTVALPDRVPVAIESGAKAFVSIHHNSSPTPTSNGTMVLYPSGDGSGLRLARSIYDRLVATLGLRPLGVVARKELRVLNDASRAGLPACLVEIGFINNRAEEAFLARSETQAAAARAIAEGIDRFFAPGQP